MHDLSLQNISDNIFSNYKETLSERVIDLSLAILGELNLLTREFVEQDVFRIHLQPAPTTKLELTDSPTFRESIRLREEFLNQHI